MRRYKKVLVRGPVVLAAVAALFLLIPGTGCSAGKAGVPLLTGSTEPAVSFGSPESGGTYKSIWNYLVDRNGRVYLWDAYGPDHIAVYDADGRFLFKFGKKGQGPEEFQALSNCAVSSSGEIWIDDGNHKTLKVYSDSGIYLHARTLPAEARSLYIKKMLFDGEDRLYLLGQTDSGATAVLRMGADDGCRTIFKDDRRQRINPVTLVPDMVLDDEGNLYITDTFDYRIHIFDRTGAPLPAFEKKGMRRQRIIEKDFSMFDGDFKVVMFPGYEEILKRLDGPSRYFPAVFGINHDRGLFYVWTSESDGSDRYFVDIYDRGFVLKDRACYYNFVRDNLAKIFEGRLYLPSIENYDTALTRKVGRLSMHNIPDHLNAYKIKAGLVR